eukprot:jgi/Tetstr1/431728/TSEL_021252.t1
MDSVVDIAIVGGGPAGLAAASALLQVGASVTVLERMPELDPVALGPDIYEAVSSVCSVGLHKTRIFSKQGDFQPTDGTDIGDFYEIAKQYGPEGSQGLATVKWHKLRDVLANNLPKGVLQTDASFSHYEEGIDGVTLHFHNRAPLHAKLLLGADGANSLVRQQALSESLPPFQGVVVWRGLVDQSRLGAIKPDDDGESSHMWADGPRFGGILRLPGKHGKEVVWMAIAPWDKDREAEIRKATHGSETAEDHQRKMERCLETMADFDNAFLRVVRASDPATMQQNTIYRRLPSVRWGAGRVSLLGDAAHLMPPNYGQGTSLALEDALALAHKVQMHGVTAIALRRYEAQRIKRVLPVQVTIAAEAHRAWVGKGAEGLIKQGAMSRQMQAFMHRLFAYKPEPLDNTRPAVAGAPAPPTTALRHISTTCRLRMAQLRSAAAVVPTLVAAHMRSHMHGH